MGCNDTTTDTIIDTTTSTITTTTTTSATTTYAITDAAMMLPTPLSVMEENIVKVTMLYYAVAVAAWYCSTVITCASNLYV